MSLVCRCTYTRATQEISSSFFLGLLLKLFKVARIARILQNEEKMLGQGSESQGFLFAKFSVAN